MRPQAGPRPSCVKFTGPAVKLKFHPPALPGPAGRGPPSNPNPKRQNHGRLGPLLPRYALTITDTVHTDTLGPSGQRLGSAPATRPRRDTKQPVARLRSHLTDGSPITRFHTSYLQIVNISRNGFTIVRSLVNFGWLHTEPSQRLWRSRLGAESIHESI